MTTLHIDASVTRELAARTVARFGGDVIRCDLTDDLPQTTKTWVNANLPRPKIATPCNTTHWPCPIN